jgi:hypothetical protein
MLKKLIEVEEKIKKGGQMTTLCSLIQTYATSFRIQEGD